MRVCGCGCYEVHSLWMVKSGRWFDSTRYVPTLHVHIDLSPCYQLRPFRMSKDGQLDEDDVHDTHTHTYTYHSNAHTLLYTHTHTTRAQSYSHTQGTMSPVYSSRLRHRPSRQESSNDDEPIVLTIRQEASEDN